MQLIVNNGFVNSVPVTVSITTNTSPPTANAGSNQLVNVGAVVTLDGSGSVDLNGYSLSYSWSLLSQPAESTATLANANAANPTFTADKAGDYIVQLIVSDPLYSSLPATVTISAN